MLKLPENPNTIALSRAASAWAFGDNAWEVVASNDYHLTLQFIGRDLVSDKVASVIVSTFCLANQPPLVLGVTGELDVFATSKGRYLPLTIAPLPTVPATTAPDPKSKTPTVPDWMRRLTPKKPSTAPLAILPLPMSPELIVGVPGAVHVKSSRSTFVPSGVPVTPSRPDVIAPLDTWNWPT
jgi:hypothetical protein